MPLQFRRGTNAERLTITPGVGEPSWTTNTNLLYVGDGTTVGGIRIELPLPSTATFATLTVTNLHFTGDPVGLDQTTAWTGTVASSQITSVSTSKVTGLSVIGYTGKLSDGIGTISTSTAAGLSTVGWSNNYNDLNNKPTPFNLATVTNQALFTTSSVQFSKLTVNTSTLSTGTSGIVVNASGGSFVFAWRGGGWSPAVSISLLPP